MQTQRVTGFTIIELLTVVAIITVLAAVTLPVFLRMGNKTRFDTCIQNMREIGTALTLYRDDYGKYPEAPRPDYLQSMLYTHGTPALSMPYREKPAVSQVPASPADTDDPVIPNDWQEWEPDPANPGYYRLFTYSDAMTPAEKVDHLKAGNYGLATLYDLYANKEERNYLRTYQGFHCPALKKSATVDRGAVLNAIEFGKDYRTFDPLFGGFNTYDVTYNYDQYNNAIRSFDEAVNYPGLNIARQLKNDTPPADTVVCWCYGHATNVDRPTYDYKSLPAVENAEDAVEKILNNQPVDVVDAIKYLDDINDTKNISDGRVLEVLNKIKDLERARAGQVSLVLWVDGTVMPVRPYLMKRHISQGDDPPQYQWFYWVPPFVYSRGDWRK